MRANFDAPRSRQTPTASPSTSLDQLIQKTKAQQAKASDLTRKAREADDALDKLLKQQPPASPQQIASARARAEKAEAHASKALGTLVGLERQANEASITANPNAPLPFAAVQDVVGDTFTVRSGSSLVNSVLGGDPGGPSVSTNLPTFKASSLANVKNPGSSLDPTPRPIDQLIKLAAQKKPDDGSSPATADRFGFTGKEKTLLDNYFANRTDRLPASIEPGSYLAYGRGLGDKNPADLGADDRATVLKNASRDPAYTFDAGQNAWVKAAGTGGLNPRVDDLTQRFEAGVVDELKKYQAAFGSLPGTSGIEGLRSLGVEETAHRIAQDFKASQLDGKSSDQLDQVEKGLSQSVKQLTNQALNPGGAIYNVGREVTLTKKFEAEVRAQLEHQNQFAFGGNLDAARVMGLDQAAKAIAADYAKNFITGKPPATLDKIEGDVKAYAESALNSASNPGGILDQYRRDHAPQVKALGDYQSALNNVIDALPASQRNAAGAYMRSELLTQFATGLRDGSIDPSTLTPVDLATRAQQALSDWAAKQG